jgi:hypothetical protein
MFLKDHSGCCVGNEFSLFIKQYRWLDQGNGRRNLRNTQIQHLFHVEGTASAYRIDAEIGREKIIKKKRNGRRH